MLKKNLRQFAGFEFEKDSAEYKKKLEAVQKNDIAKLKSVCEGLQLDKKGSKDALSQRICEFLLAPEGNEELEDDAEEEEEEEEESESEQEITPKKKRGAPAGNKRNARDEKVSKTGRPRRATAGRGRGKHFKMNTALFIQGFCVGWSWYSFVFSFPFLSWPRLQTVPRMWTIPVQTRTRLSPELKNEDEEMIPIAVQM